MSVAAEDLVHYVLIRGDLEWPAGALVTQAVHASNSCLFEFMQDAACGPDISAYLKRGFEMRTVVKKLSSEAELQALSNSLRENAIPHKVWIEHPENVASALAIVPMLKSKVFSFVKKFPFF